ncbi:WGR domain-containing protein, partial [Streptomyces sp. NPDC002586]
MTTGDAVNAYGWEMHNDSGTSDKYYQLFVVFSPSPVMLTHHGRSGQAGQLGSSLASAQAEEVIAEAVKVTQSKERKGYYLSRDLVEFTLPAELLTPHDLQQNVREIAKRFSSAATNAT